MGIRHEVNAATGCSVLHPRKEDVPEAVVVAGAGAAGIAAAISAARCGATVYLIEKTGNVGGTVTGCLIHTIGGLYDSDGEYLNHGLSVELAERLTLASADTHRRKIGRVWTLSVDIEVYKKVVSAWLEEERKIRILRRSRIAKLELLDNRIIGLHLIVNGRERIMRPKSVIDTTGSAEVVRLVDPGLVTEGQRAAAGLIFQMRGIVPGALQFPNSVELLRSIRRAAEAEELPRECAMAWIDSGVYDGEAYVKLFAPLGPNWREPAAWASATRTAHAARDRLIAFLRRQPSFAHARLTKTGRLGIRDGGSAKGEYCLTTDDVKCLRKFADAAARCSWPIEHWDPAAGVTLEYLTASEYYEIPLKSLKVFRMKNLWVAGKCLSAEHLAQASARVAGCCWAMGEAAGKAAAS